MTLLNAAKSFPQAMPGSLLSILTRDFVSNGWPLSDLRKFTMEDPPAPPAPPAPVVTPPAPPVPPAPLGITQDDLNRIAAREKDEGKRAAEKAIAEQLGCTPEEAKAIIDKKKADDAAAMTEVERLQAAADEREKQASAREAAAVDRERRASLREQLAEAGVKTDRKDGALTLVLAGLDPAADEAAIKTAVEACKTSYPEFFGAGVATPPSGGPLGGPPNTPPAAGGSIAAAREKARTAREAAASNNGSGPFGNLQVLGS